MKHRAFLPLLVVFLVFSSASAVPISRSLNSFRDGPSIQDLLAQGEMDMRTKLELSDADHVEEVFIKGRMDFENTDYPGTGANNHHDPQTPARLLN